MPSASLHPCPCGCSTLLQSGIRRCTQRGKSQAWQRTNPPERIRGEKLQRLRNRLFDEQPLCVLCLQQGRVRMATIRDHVIPLAEGGADDETNVQAVCSDCHAVKTQQEAQRGAARRQVTR